MVPNIRLDSLGGICVATPLGVVHLGWSESSFISIICKKYNIHDGPVLTLVHQDILEHIKDND